MNTPSMLTVFIVFEHFKKIVKMSYNENLSGKWDNQLSKSYNFKFQYGKS